MLSYRHGFHAGSFVDVHKHVVQSAVLTYLHEKDTPFCFIDTHAGAGIYDLASRFALKNREFETGISRIWDASGAPGAVAHYLTLVHAVNPDGTLRYYPGSPGIARALMRKQDRMVLIELHNSEAPILKGQFRRDRQVAVHHRDAYEALPALVPPRERRGLVFIDPSYELRDEFVQATDALIAAWRKWPLGIYMIWYPLQRRQPIQQFLRALRRSGMRRILLSELPVTVDDTPNRLAGSGLAIVNPPWQFESVLEELVSWLTPKLDRGAIHPPRTDWLVRE